MKKITGLELIHLFEQFSPKRYALDGDPIGLHIGTLHKPIQKVMITLDVLEEVVDEAIEQDVQLIIAHHPPIFKPLKKIATDQPSGRIIEKLIKHDIAVYAAHTNLDVARGGVNDLLAQALQLQNTEVLVPTYEEQLKKLAVFVPKENANELREALGNAGAGAIGKYSHCSFSKEGTGRFLPGEDANPHIGKVGQIEAVPEERVETIYPQHMEKQVLTAMKKAHPYEEVAYDIYRLENEGESLGLGRIGTLSRAMTLREFANFVKEALDVDGVRVVGNLDETVTKVAILGGDGNKYYQTAKFKGADVYVTGDFYYHTAHEAMNIGLNVIDPGHHVEKVMIKGVKDILEEKCAGKNFAVDIITSKINTDPFTFI